MYRDVLAHIGSMKVSERLLHQKCREEHLALISLHFQWRTVGAFLKLREQQLQDIEVDYRTEQERRLATLRSWLRTFGDQATYGVLMRAMLRCRQRENAMQVGVILLRSEKRLNSDSSMDTDLEYRTPPETPPTPPRQRSARVSAVLERGSTVMDRRPTDSIVIQIDNPAAHLPTVTNPPRRENEYALLPKLASSVPLCSSPVSSSINSIPPPIPPRPIGLSAAAAALPPPPSKRRPYNNNMQAHRIIRTGTPGTFSKKTICLYLLAPSIFILGLVILVIAVTYGVVYAMRS